MTLRNAMDPQMLSLRTASLALAAILPVAILAAPLSAQTQTSHFLVELAQPTQAETAVAGGVVFRCEGNQCTAPKSRTRPLRVCRELQREVGTISAFSYGGDLLEEDQLARCNR